MKLNDHYFIAWLKTKGYLYVLKETGIYVDITPEALQVELKQYNEIKPLLKEVRSTVKFLASIYKEK